MDEKELEIVEGDGSDLEISPAYDHLNVSVPKSAKNKKPTNIVIPEEKHKKEDNGNDK